MPFAIFLLDLNPTSTEDFIDRNVSILKSIAVSTAFEVCQGSSLQALPSSLVSPISEYPLIVIYVATADLEKKHAAHLTTLNPQFPFLVVMECASTVKLQCAAISSPHSKGDGKIGLLLELLIALATVQNEKPNVESLVRRCSTGFQIINPALAINTVVWPAIATDTFSYLTTVSIPCDNGGVTGHTAGGHLKKVLPNCRIRLQKDKTLSARIELVEEDKALIGAVQAHFTAANQSPATGIDLGENMYSFVLPLTAVPELSKIATTPQLVTKKEISFVGLNFVCEMTSTLATFFDVERMLRVAVPTEDGALMVEDLQMPYKPVITPQRSPVLSALSLPISTSIMLPTPPPVVPSTARSPPPLLLDATATPSSKDPTLTLSEVDSLITAAFTKYDHSALRNQVGRLEAALMSQTSEVDILRQEVFRLKSQPNDLRQQVQLLEGTLSTHVVEHGGLKREVSGLTRDLEIVKNKAPAPPVPDSSLALIKSQLLGLQKDVESIRATAADHKLVEGALKEIQRQVPTSEQISTAVKEASREYQQIPLQVSELQRQLSETWRTVDGRDNKLREIYEVAQKNGGAWESIHTTVTKLQTIQVQHEEKLAEIQKRTNQFHKAFELAADKLHAQCSQLAEEVESDKRGRSASSSQLQAAHVSDVDFKIKSFQADLELFKVAQKEALGREVQDCRTFCTQASENLLTTYNHRASTQESKLEQQLRKHVDDILLQNKREIEFSEQRLDLKLQKAMHEKSTTASPNSREVNLLASPLSQRSAVSPRFDELDMVKSITTRNSTELKEVRDRVRQLELVQAEVSTVLSAEESVLRHVAVVEERLDKLEMHVRTRDIK